MSARFVIRLLTDAALPVMLLKRLADDRRLHDPDLQAEHDLLLHSGMDDVEQIRRRSFTESEARLACREWVATQRKLDVLVASARVTLHAVALDAILGGQSPLPRLRLLPLIGEDGQEQEMDCATAAWPSQRVREGIFFRPLTSARQRTPCWKVEALQTDGTGCRRAVVGRYSGRWSDFERMRRFQFAECRWLSSSFRGHDLLQAMSVALAPDEAFRLACSAAQDREFERIQLRPGSLDDIVGSAEFESGIASRPARVIPASRAACVAVGGPAHWVHFPEASD